MIEGGYTVKEVVDNYRLTIDEEDALNLFNAITNIINRNLEVLLVEEEADALTKLHMVLAESIKQGIENE